MIGLAHRAAIAAAFLVTLAGTASARDVTPEETAALAARIDAFEAAILAGDAETTFAVLPPLMLPAIAAAAGANLDEVIAEARFAMAETMAMLTAFTFDMDLAGARYLELPDGTPYALVPTETYAEAGTVTIRSTTETLAMLDEGLWYLLRVDEAAQVAVLRTTYPLFADVQFNDPVTEVIER